MKEFDYRAYSVIGPIDVLVKFLPCPPAQAVGVVGLLNHTMQSSSRTGYKNSNPFRLIGVYLRCNTVSYIIIIGSSLHLTAPLALFLKCLQTKLLQLATRAAE